VCDDDVDVFSAVWGLEGYYDVTVAKREAHRLLLTNVERSFRKSLLEDGTELVEMPVRYDRSVCVCLSVCLSVCGLCHMVPQQVIDRFQPNHVEGETLSNDRCIRFCD